MICARFRVPGPFPIWGARKKGEVFHRGRRVLTACFNWRKHANKLGVASALAGPPSFSFLGDKLVMVTSGGRGLKRGFGTVGSSHDAFHNVFANPFSFFLDGPMRSAQ